MKLSWILSTGLFALAVSSCMESQPIPDLVKLPTSDFNTETIADGLSMPWSVATLPDGSYLVTEKTGALKHIAQDKTVTEISGLPNDIHVQEQGGLLEVAIDPDHAINGLIYLSYATGSKKANATRLYKARLGENTLHDGEVIFTSGPTKDTGSHFGGRIAFLPDDSLILTLGDGFTYREEAQNKASHLGKIVRIDRDGNSPADNPFVDEEGARPEIYSWGHRNVQGLHYDAVTGNLWANEHGPKGGDELNLIKSGHNYGWPIATTGVDYNGAKITPFKTAEGTEPFVKDWVPSIAPSGLTIYRGDMFPEWEGDAFVGGLAPRDLRRIDLENGKAVNEEILLDDLDARIRDVRTDLDGALLVVTDDPENGKVIRISSKN